MKSKADLARAWLRKARSDELALDGCLAVRAFDAACFHAQQAAEKYLKAFLVYTDIAFPLTHNLARLVEHCSSPDASFRSLIPVVEPLTPYAVELRYDDEFWPSVEVAREARASALAVREFVLSRLPPEIAVAAS
ncbi:MAG: hypothetical protein AMS14_06395 [Planctomycetes bacterium DG_20]|nr:MAG: hypothetical protein AMS14_06395 [Planctomycetes bacterium DG_20]